MKILALETANEQCSIALIDAEQLLFFQQYHEPRAQTQKILPMIEQAMLETDSTWSDISAIAFSRGPGSFSGVRINAAVTQALAWANDIPVIPVSTLQALAQHAFAESGLTEVTAVIDARMNEVYIASFSVDAENVMQVIDDEQLLNYASAQKSAKFELIGSGAKLLGNDCDTKLCFANAKDIAQIARVEFAKGHMVSAEQALPVYLRDNAWKKLADQGKQ